MYTIKQVENGLNIHAMGVDISFTKEDIEKAYSMIMAG